MEDSKEDLEKNQTNKYNDNKKGNGNENNIIDIESKKNEDIENKITAMIAKVIDEQDNNNDNNKNDINKKRKSVTSLNFNDEDEHLPKSNKKLDVVSSLFDRGSKRLKIVANYPVNIMNMPFMDINQFNNNNNFTSMRAHLLLAA